MLSLVAVFAIAWLVVNGIGGFRGTFRPVRCHALESRLMTQLAGGPIGGLPCLAPERYVRALDKQLGHGDRGQGTYVDGRLRRTGVWYYYLYALALKVPPAFHLLTLVGLVAWATGRPAGKPRTVDVGVLVVALGVVAVGSASNLQMGLRYVLPALPLVWLVVGRGIAWLSAGRVGATAAGILVVAGVIDGLRFWPDQIGYFNAFVGDSRQAWRRLADSNLDWGQGLIRLKGYLDERQPKTLYLAYWGRVDPQVYGISGWQLPAGEPRPGTYVVSLNFLAGIPYQVLRPDGLWKIGKQHSKGIWYCAPSDGKGGWNRDRQAVLNWLMAREPDESLGYGLVVYHIQ